MTMLTVDGIKIDTTNWIDAHVAKFKDRSVPWAFRRHELLREIADFQQVLRDFGTKVPHDVPGEAHTKAYLMALEQADKALMKEITVT